MNTTANSPHPRCLNLMHGMSIIELLIAMAIGLFIIAGAITLITSIRSSEQHANQVLELQEDAKFALNIIGHDLRMANYWGLHNDAERILINTAPAVFCRGQDVSAQTYRLNNPLELNNELLTCARPDNPADQLTVRYVSPQTQLPDPRYVQLYTDYDHGYLHAGTKTPDSAVNALKNFTLIVNNYYIDSIQTAGRSELRRWSLGPHHKFYNELVAANISDINIVWGEKISDAWVWHRNKTPMPLLARVEVTATGMSGGQRIEQKLSKVFRLQNIQPIDEAASNAKANL